MPTYSEPFKEYKEFLNNPIRIDLTISGILQDSKIPHLEEKTGVFLEN